LIKDHLGNTRVAFTNSSGTIALVQENHYYTFGMSQAGWLAEPSPTNAYKYNGKELNTEFGLNLMDYGARWYDGGIARFTSVDALADHPNQSNKSPYAYAWNNPVNLTDPDGNCPTCPLAVAGGILGGLIGGGIEAGRQLINSGKISDWNAVGGATAQGAITGAAAGLTGGTSLLAVTGAGAAANVLGGAASNAIQGKDITVGSVATDAAIGATAALGGAVVGSIIEKAQVGNTLKAIGTQAQANVTASTGKVAGEKGFGTLAHSEFKTLVDAKGLKNVATEVSYKSGQIVKYGTPGSTRADAVLMNNNGTVRQIFDLKTGNATLGQRQMNNYLNNVPGINSSNQIKIIK